MSERQSYKVLYLLNYFKNIDVVENGIICDNEYYYPLNWLDNDYLFNKICEVIK